MTTADQIAAINRKRDDEHRRVDLQHDQLVQQVRDRCEHEEGEHGIIGFSIKTGKCKHCGAPMGVESQTDSGDI